MDRSIVTSVRGLERRARLGRWITAAVVIVGITAWLGGIPGTTLVEAQQPKLRRAEPASRPRMEYRQSEIPYTRMAEMLNDWEAKGWEAFEIVPVQAVNPGAGGAMTVAIVFRRAAK